MTKCPRCGKDVSSRPGTICPRCGLRVYEVNEKVRCPEPSCRALVSKKLDYCPKCGCKLKGYLNVASNLLPCFEVSDFTLAEPFFRMLFTIVLLGFFL